MFNKQQQRAEFMSHVRNVYNDDTLELSDEFKKELVKCAQGIEAGDKISFLASRLHIYVMDELRRLNFKKVDKLLILKSYLEKKEWWYTLGAFIRLS